MPGNNSRQIPDVADNIEKQDAYRRTLGRFNKAKKEGFFLEAMWILYAMMEDRTTAFLYYAGFTDEKNRTNPANKVKSDIRIILKIADGKNISGFNTLAVKLDTISKILAWAKTAGSLSGYKQDLQTRIIKKVKIPELQAALIAMDDWRDFRNQIVHALFDKKAGEVRDRLERLVNDGFNAIRVLDNAVKALKSGTNIRIQYNIQ